MLASQRSGFLCFTRNPENLKLNNSKGTDKAPIPQSIRSPRFTFQWDPISAGSVTYISNEVNSIPSQCDQHRPPAWSNVCPKPLASVTKTPGVTKTTPQTGSPKQCPNHSVHVFLRVPKTCPKSLGGVTKTPGWCDQNPWVV